MHEVHGHHALQVGVVPQVAQAFGDVGAESPEAGTAIGSGCGPGCLKPGGDRDQGDHREGVGHRVKRIRVRRPGRGGRAEADDRRPERRAEDRRHPVRRLVECLGRRDLGAGYHPWQGRHLGEVRERLRRPLHQGDHVELRDR